MLFKSVISFSALSITGTFKLLSNLKDCKWALYILIVSLFIMISVKIAPLLEFSNFIVPDEYIGNLENVA